MISMFVMFFYQIFLEIVSESSSRYKRLLFLDFRKLIRCHLFLLLHLA